MKGIKLGGTYTALVTPFKTDGSVDFDAFEKLIEFQINNGVEGIVVCGSTGESATLTNKEKQALIIKAVEFTAGRVPVIAGTGTYDSQVTLDLSVLAGQFGADALLLVAPYYNKPTQDGLYEHFRLVAEHVDLPIIIYNIPGRTGVNIHPETQLKLAENYSNIVATKEASANLEQMMQIIRNAPKHFSLLSGDDALTLPIISIGGKGIVSVISNYLPKKFSDCIRLALKGKMEEARKIHYELLELMELGFIETNPVPVKYVLSQMGMLKEVYRMPLLPMKIENKKKLKNALIEAGIIQANTKGKVKA